MFGLGFLEICVIAVVTLIFVGPQKLPEIMKQFGRFFIYLKRTSIEVQSTVQDSLDEIEKETNKNQQEQTKVSPLESSFSSSDPFTLDTQENISLFENNHTIVSNEKTTQKQNQTTEEN